MIAVNPLLIDVARYLTDYDSTSPQDQHVTWTRPDLVSYLQLAMAALQASVAQAFSRTLEMPLTGADVERLPAECDEYLGLVGYRRADGTLDTTARDNRTRRTIVARPLCPSPDGTIGTPTIIIDPEGPRDAIVTPPTSVGSLVIRCSCTPVIDFLATDAAIDLQPKYRAVLFNWMVAYAYGTETESTPLRERSDAHWKRGGDMLGITTAALTRLKKGT